MADDGDDPWDPQTYAPTRPQDDPNYLNPAPGTTSSVNIGENDPLRSWASQMTPDQFANFQAKHAQGDFEGAKQDLINQGVPPPDHHYDSNGQPFYPTDAMGDTQLSAGGQVRTVAPPAVSSELGPGETGTNPTVEQAKRNWEKANQAQPYPPGQQPGTPPITQPPAPTTAPAPTVPSSIPTPQQARERLGGATKKFFGSGDAASATGQPVTEENPSKGQPLVPRERPAGAPKKTTYESPDGGKVTIEHAQPSEDGGKVPLPRERPKEAPDRKTVLQRLEQGAEAGGSSLAKSLEGVKAPPRLNPPNIGAVAPRGPVSVGHPQLNTILSMIGQNPSAAQGLLQRLGLRM